MESDRFNYLRILAILGFVFITLISTWATVMSVHRQISYVPIAVIWGIVILFYWVASYSVSLILKGFNYRQKLYNRHLHLLGGFVLLILFWAMFSFPTNIHTAFYISKIREVCLTELVGTETILIKIKADREGIVRKRKLKLKATVEAEIENLEYEIKNKYLEGYAIRGKKITNRISDIIYSEPEKITHLTPPRGNEITPTSLDEFAKSMVKLVRSHLDIKMQEYDELNKILEDELSTKEIDSLSSRLQFEHVNLKNIPTESTKKLLITCFAKIKRYHAILESNLKDEINIPVLDEIPETIKMEDVFLILGRLWNGYYQDSRKFTYISILLGLLDLMGFLLYSRITRYFQYDE